MRPADPHPARKKFLRLAALFLGTLQALRLAYEAGTLTAEALADQLHEVIAGAYTSSFLFGREAVGAAEALTEEETALLVGVRAKEFEYLNGFIEDLESGAGTLGPEQRMSLYGHALNKVFWLGVVRGAVDQRKLVVWGLGDTDHCETCAGMAEATEKGVPADEFWTRWGASGIVPQSPVLACKGFFCECHLIVSTA